MSAPPRWWRVWRWVDRFCQAGAKGLRPRRGAPGPTRTTTTTVVPPEFIIMSLAGHKPSGLADAFGGYLCACRQSSWSHLAAFGPHGGCASGWYDAREFLARRTVRDGAE